MDRSPFARDPGRLKIAAGLATFRPRGEYSLVEAVALISSAIACGRDRGVSRLLIDARGLTGVQIPSLVDRFLMVEEWAHHAGGLVIVALVALPEYIHPEKFGVKVAKDFGLVCNVHTSGEAASKWLREAEQQTFVQQK